MPVTLGIKLTQLLAVLLRLFVASAIAAPIVLFTVSALVGINKDWFNPLDHLDSVAACSLILWAAAVVVGFPVAILVVNSVKSTSCRFWFIILIGTVLAAFLTLPMGGMGFPAGTITATSCFLLNYNLLKQESFMFVGKIYGPKSGV